MAHTQRTLALQLERLTKEASGVKARMAALSSENTRLKRELTEKTVGADRDAATIRRQTSGLGSAQAELQAMREQRDADARRETNEKMQADARMARLNQQLKDTERELAAADRLLASNEYNGEQREQKLKETSTLASDQGLELVQLRAAYADQAQALDDEEGLRRRAEGDASRMREEVRLMEGRLAARSKELSRARTELGLQRAELEAQHRTIQQMSAADSTVVSARTPETPVSCCSVLSCRIGGGRARTATSLAMPSVRSVR